MAFFSTIIAAIGIAAGIAGTVVQMQAAKKAEKAQKQQAFYQVQAIEEQKKAEKARQDQMNLDATRRRREVLRQQQLARAQALSAATAQGAQGGSALPGAYGEISGASNTNIAGVNAAQNVGNRIFDANMAAHDNYKQVAFWGGKAAEANTLSSIGSGISSLGGTLVRNMGTISKIGA